MVMLMVFLIVSQIEIEAKLDKQYLSKKLTVGDPFEITLTLTYPQNTDISEPFVDSIEPFGILNQENKIVQEKGIITNTYQMQVVAFNTGELKVPAFLFLHTHDNSIDTLKSNTLPITIESVMPEDMSDINDLKKAVEFPNYLPLIVAGIILICTAAGYFGYKYFKKLRKARTIAKPPVPPWIEAIVAIENIPIKEWLEKGLIKKYYYALSEILKRYIERRFEFNAAEQTTTEIIATLKLQKISLRDDFDRFFTRADLVKYAKFMPPQEELHTVVQKVKELVNRTKPEEKPVEKK